MMMIGIPVVTNECVQGSDQGRIGLVTGLKKPVAS